MKVLILGGNGMAGHIMKQYYLAKKKYDVFYTSRDRYDKNSIFLDVTDFRRVEEVIDKIKPDIVINCIGILNKHASQDQLLAIQVNSLLPHQLAKLSQHNGGKLIHISTDCVFSGTKGDYKENEIPDGTSDYAQSKRLGEIKNDKHLTIRTSIIGPELKDNGIGLFLWFMKQTGEIKGFEKVLWNGVTTLELAKATEELIHQKVTGLVHLCSDTKISKYHLLKNIQKVFNKYNVNIIPDDNVVLDRTLKNTRTDFSYSIPSYQEMLFELRNWILNNHENA